jgi:hypothetical protein
MKRLLAIGLALAVAGCATPSPEARIRARLIEVGLSRPMASCMAERLVDRLSIAELRRLGSLVKLGNRDIGEMTVDEFIHRIRALQDPHILKVVTTAGLGCAIAT